ncbi:MAG: pyruvate ferredoxin oxidoreductase [Patescibacteria group bacterium]|nr:pyruvate ferredoxin oxidoreductase [Patescibacteria group bacterium]
MKKISLTGNEAVAYALKQVEPEVISFYPITPTTEIIQLTNKYILEGKMKTEMILAESEHSALSACVGAAACNLRTVTATASQGLLYMHEVLTVASGLNLPIVMIVGNRSISAPLNIHNDHSDTMAVKDSGWLQFYAENPQEAYYLTILAFKITNLIKIPAMICLDGFITTHELTKINILSDKEVKNFLGKKDKQKSLFNFEKAPIFGQLSLPDSYLYFRFKLAKKIKKSKKIIEKTFTNFNQKFQTHFNLIETFNLTTAKNIIIASSSICGTIKETITQNLKEWGLIKITTYRPFPKKSLINICKNKEKIIILDKSLTFKGEKTGHLYEEVKEALFDLQEKPKIFGEVVGLGGKAFSPKDLKKLIQKYE